VATGTAELRASTPDTTGSAYVARLDSTISMLHLGFTKDVVSRWFGRLVVPANYASGGSFKLFVLANATTGVTRLNVELLSVSDAEDLDPALTANTAQDVTVPGTAFLAKLVTFTSLPTLQAGDTLLAAILHDGTHANDTLAVDTLVASAWLEYTTT
jgi:hypothetical protein